MRRALRERQGLDTCRGTEADAVCVNARSLPEFERAGCVALFAALPDEVPTRPLFDASRADGKRCLLPRTTQAGALEFSEIADWEDLRPGRYGVLEPSASATPASLSEAQVVVVPGVAFDAVGGRLGRGGGYYDVALAGLERDRCLVVGVGLTSQCVDEVPRGELDQLVDVVVTEQAVLRGWKR